MVEYVNSGKINNLEGTSFATPKITAVFAEAWYNLKNEGYEINPDKLINFYCVGSGPDKKKIQNLIQVLSGDLRQMNFLERFMIQSRDFH